MLLASYTGTRPGLQGLANRAIRFRLGGPYSHTELVFEPGDGVGRAHARRHVRSRRTGLCGAGRAWRPSRCPCTRRAGPGGQAVSG